jgi:non-specific serine/threonine protein kinase
MNEIHPGKNSNCILPKNIIMKKVKNLKKNLNSNNTNKYNLFHSNLSKPQKSSNIFVHKISNYNNTKKSKQNFQGKTAKVSPINFHNKIIGYININKVSSIIPTMMLNLNSKKYNIDNKKNKSDSKSKTKSKSKSNQKSNKKKKSKDQSRNLNKEFCKCSRFSKVNLPKKINYIHSISHIQNSIFRPKEFFDNNNKVKLNNIKKIIKKKTRNNIINKNYNNIKRNILNNNSSSSNTNYNLVSAIRKKHNSKVMKLINNIITKKKFGNLKKSSNTAINSTKNSKEKKKINNITHYNIKKNNQVISNKRKYNINNIIPKKLKNKTHFSGSNIIRNIYVVPNNEANLHSLINKYSIVTQENYKRNKNNNYYHQNYFDCIQSSINIKNKKINFFNYEFNYDINNYLSRSLGNTIVKIKSAQNSRTKTKTRTEMKHKKTKNQMNNNLFGKFYENFNSNLTHKLFPITTTQTKYNINCKRNSDNKNNSITKTHNNVNNIRINFNITENNKIKSKSHSKSKSRNKKRDNQKDANNNISNIKYSKNKKQKNSKHYYKKNKFEKKNNVNKINKKIEPRRNNINNFIFNIIHNKSNQESISSDIQKINKNMNLTSSLLQNEYKTKDNKIAKNNKYNNYNDFVINESLKESNSNTTNNKNLKEELSIIMSHKDYNYYQEESRKLSDKIKQYGKEHNYVEYPKTDLSYYKIGRSIGHGAFGKVNLALHVLSGKIVSIKSFNKKKDIFSVNKIKNEVKIMSKLRKHNNIVKLFELFETEDHYCLVMENVVGGNLLNAINKMNKIPENLAKIIFKQLIKTLQYIHSNGIVHRDIKPDNILLDLDNTIKICDFGVSKIIAEGQLIRDSCGTPAFVAPEILLNYSYDPFPTDIWSSGVVLYAMTTGFFPFRGVNETQLHDSILTGIFPKPKDISNELNDLLSKILNINPKKRITLEDILLHPWFKNDMNNKKQKKNVYTLNLFTKAEKIIYSKLKLDYRKINKDIQLESFTNKNINTYFEEANQNVHTISFVFTPYNTRREKDEDDDLYYEDVNIEDEIIKYIPKVQEISRLYEIHNNCDFDQGYIVGRKQMWKKKLMGSIDNSYDKKKNKDIIDNKEKNNNSSNKKEISSLNSNFLKTNNSINDDKLLIDNDAVKYVENFGYKKEFIIKSIELNELNHASATYYLKLSFKNG